MRAALLLPVVALLWAGMLLGISFLEAWVKFQAPSLSLEEGLDVGRHVFGAFNLVEIAAAVLLAALAYAARASRRVLVALGVAVAVVAVQSAWLLPVLDERVELILAGGDPPDAPYHVLYIGLEGVKLLALLVAGLGALAAATRSPRGREALDLDEAPRAVGVLGDEVRKPAARHQAL